MTSKRLVYFAHEAAEALGMSLDTFYRQREALHARGMPQPIAGGKLRIPRPEFDAWLRGRKPPPQPANDIAIVTNMTDEEHRARLARAYAGQ